MKLIDKDALAAWIESQIDSLERNSGCSGIFGEYQMAVYDKLLSFIDTLNVKEVNEVKGVDLDNELDFVKDAYYYFTSDERSSMKKVARHFLELGLKMKGE